MSLWVAGGQQKACERALMSVCVCMTGEPGESMTHMLFQTSVTLFFSMLQNKL